MRIEIVFLECAYYPFLVYRAIEEMVKKGQSSQSSASSSEFTELKRDAEEKVTFNMQTSSLPAGMILS